MDEQKSEDTLYFEMKANDYYVVFRSVNDRRNWEPRGSYKVTFHWYKNTYVFLVAVNRLNIEIIIKFCEGNFQYYVALRIATSSALNAT